jgi:carbon monoxide dehydrogenase subunit G
MNMRISVAFMIMILVSSCSIDKKTVQKKQLKETSIIDQSNSVFTEIEINATPEQVWSVLTDWKSLKDWSSSFIGISTEKMVKGEIFVSYFKNTITGKTIEFEHICTEYVEGERFGWSGHIAGKAKDHHIYSVIPSKNGTTIFRQEDGLHGSTFFNFLAKYQMMTMYSKFNQELKERVEVLYPRG